MSGASIVVRPARFDEVHACSVIWRELMEHHERTDKRFLLAHDASVRWRGLAHDLMRRDDSFLLVAVGGQGSGNEVRGFCLGWLAKNPPIYRVDEVGFVSEIAVAHGFQRQGIGRALISGARRWFAHKHVDEFQLSTAIWNEGAQAFWKSLGGEPLLLRFRFDVVA